MAWRNFWKVKESRAIQINENRWDKKCFENWREKNSHTHTHNDKLRTRCSKWNMVQNNCGFWVFEPLYCAHFRATKVYMKNEKYRMFEFGQLNQSGIIYLLFPLFECIVLNFISNFKYVVRALAEAKESHNRLSISIDGKRWNENDGNFQKK